MLYSLSLVQPSFGRLETLKQRTPLTQMLFGVRLQNEIYEPWKDHYINYDSLKRLLRENVVPNDKEEWSESDETRFVQALDSDLEKVYSFQTNMYNKLSDAIGEIEKQIVEVKEIDLVNLEHTIEDILESAQQLEHFSRINFTGFTKIVKKHDRLHSKYSVKPLLQVRLKALPFHSEDYSPLINRLSAVYSFLREQAPQSQSASINAKLSSYTNDSDLNYTSYKFWVHSDNLMEVKTRILRHLPILVYNNQNDSQDSVDPTLTSLYFDNSDFELYEGKLQKNDTSPSLRLKWAGKTSDEDSQIYIEKRTVDHSIAGGDERLPIKEKYIAGFINGTYHMEKTVQKMKSSHVPDYQVEGYEKSVENIQDFIRENSLQPVCRAQYTRTAFQIPGDNRVRVIMDNDILFIKEDAFDKDRPIRDPNNWHRTDIDAVSDPKKVLRKGEYSKFPYAVLEFRVQNRPGVDTADTGNSIITSSSVYRKHGKWIDELTSSHLVKEVPKFSKFIQGIASLYGEDDKLNFLPLWLSVLEEDDIRIDPKQAFEQETKKLKERAKTAAVRARAASVSSPRKGATTPAGPSFSTKKVTIMEDDSDSDDDEGRPKNRKSLKHKYSIPFLGTFGPKLDDALSEDEEVVLPPGVVKPDVLIRNTGPVKVETKVWLANERTFNKWLHITTLLSALTFTLYSSVQAAVDKSVATYVAYTLFALTLFSGIWGWSTYMSRLNYIKQRSEKHLDNPIGPLIIAVALLLILIVNFIATYKAVGEPVPLWN
ncbi:uncharacterized protein YALI1_C14498g [Yarrowia lipolytica]|uniref:SPX domain-containing protein n=1 Tax=Yarrowia lipolytica TaxID=4952 RepID=A0A1D8NAH5_YARLL|nr:hypothetical protein YALI1_C14498g [Yarrowia lipolytica]